MGEYRDVLREAFYRFAGVSPYSNSNLRMTKGDLQMFLQCLELEKHLESIFNNMETDKKLSFSIAEFMDYFLESEDLLVGQKGYDYLGVTLQTMKNMDPNYKNRVNFEMFLDMVSVFFDEEEARVIFDDFDTDKIGLLHVANMFNFFKNYCALEDSS